MVRLWQTITWKSSNKQPDPKQQKLEEFLKFEVGKNDNAQLHNFFTSHTRQKNCFVPNYIFLVWILLNYKQVHYVAKLDQLMTLFEEMGKSK